VKLTQEETQVMQEVEEARTRVLRGLEHGGDLVVLAQQAGEWGDLVLELASLLVVRAKRENPRAAKKAVKVP
jgi:hypothetical protein